MDTEELKKIYPQLYAYTYTLLESHQWFRPDKSGSYLMGQQADDYVQEALARYLTHPEKFDKSSGRSLANYLKEHIIRSLVGKDSRREENKTSSSLYVAGTDEEGEEDAFRLNPFLSSEVPSHDEEIDYQTIMSDIANQVEHDEIVKTIFEGVCRDGLSRGQVISIDNITPKEFDKGKKRLETILNKTAQKYNIVKSQ